MADKTYLWDANAFIDVGAQFYPADVFGCLWTNLRVALGTTIITTGSVLDQIKLAPNHKQPWRDEVAKLCKSSVIDESEPAVQAKLRELANRVARRLMKNLKDVDLQVVSVAIVHSLPLVTRDGDMAAEATKLNVHAMYPVDCFRRLKWSCR
jgi:predicted nucleic acid-binding protein